MGRTKGLVGFLCLFSGKTNGLLGKQGESMTVCNKVGLCHLSSPCERPIFFLEARYPEGVYDGFRLERLFFFSYIREPLKRLLPVSAVYQSLPFKIIFKWALRS